MFDEQVSLATLTDAADVLSGTGGASATADLDRYILTSWLNVANGGIRFSQAVDTDGDRLPDTPFSSLLAEIEADRLDAATSAAVLADHETLLRTLNR